MAEATPCAQDYPDRYDAIYQAVSAGMTTLARRWCTQAGQREMSRSTLSAASTHLRMTDAAAFKAAVRGAVGRARAGRRRVANGGRGCRCSVDGAGQKK